MPAVPPPLPNRDDEAPGATRTDPRIEADAQLEPEHIEHPNPEPMEEQPTPNLSAYSPWAA
jgi:hypothetical protein